MQRKGSNLFTVLSNNGTVWFQVFFVTASRNASTIKSHSEGPPSRPGLATSILHSVSINLPILMLVKADTKCHLMTYFTHFMCLLFISIMAFVRLSLIFMDNLVDIYLHFTFP